MIDKDWQISIIFLQLLSQLFFVFVLHEQNLELEQVFEKNLWRWMNFGLEIGD